jgi:hypothetical protein
MCPTSRPLSLKNSRYGPYGVKAAMQNSFNVQIIRGNKSEYSEALVGKKFVMIVHHPRTSTPRTSYLHRCETNLKKKIYSLSAPQKYCQVIDYRRILD